MNALGKFLADGLNVRRETKVVKMQHKLGGGELMIENQLAQLSYHPCLALLLKLGKASAFARFVLNSHLSTLN